MIFKIDLAEPTRISARANDGKLKTVIDGFNAWRDQTVKLANVASK